MTVFRIGKFRSSPPAVTQQLPTDAELLALRLKISVCLLLSLAQHQSDSFDSEYLKSTHVIAV